MFPDIFLIDYASVVFIGFATISAVWYLLSTSVLLNLGYLLLIDLGGRANFQGPPIPKETIESKTS